MLMLNAFMDETGHSRAIDQAFNGMAGLVAPAENWQAFEVRWRKTLKDFKIPFFHMKDFAHSLGFFDGWSELKRRKLFSKLMTHIEMTYAFPVSSIMLMDDYRSFTEKQQNFFYDPYHLHFMNLIASCTTLLEYAKANEEEKVALIFSEQVEFRHKALQIYEMVKKERTILRRSAHPPIFNDMRDVLPLQAADIVAYEMYKEHERQIYRPHMKPRYGFTRIMAMSKRHGRLPLMRRFTKTLLTAIMEDTELIDKQHAYWTKKRATS